jgi:glyoxylase-like metal-dependent hydrolase (beta-lactamase superfamily II)
MSARSCRVEVALPRIANAWLLSDAEGRRFLIDTGHRLERQALAMSLRRAGVQRGGLTAVLLTHRHSDHAGNAAWLRSELSCPVICHAADAATLSGHEPRPRLAGRGLGAIHDALCRVEDAFPARSPVDDVYDEGSWRWGFEVIPVAGHTAGSALLLHEPSGTLFTGDAILAGAPVQRLHTRLSLAIPAYSVDVRACHRATLAFLAEQRPLRTLCAGHGPQVSQRLPELLDRLRVESAERDRP